MTRKGASLRRAAFAACLLSSVPASGQTYEEDSPVPPGAKGEVLPLQGKIVEIKVQVLDINAQVLDIKGMASELSARVNPLAAALKDLGASVTGKEIKISLSADVLFDFDKAVLRPEAAPALEKVAAVLKAYSNAAVSIEGHTDGKGADKYNQPLSEKRATSVRRWLGEHGVKSAMTVRGWGKQKPVALNTKPNGKDDPEGRQKNRRVEITVKTP